MGERDERSAVRIHGKSEWGERSRRRRNRRWRRPGDRAAVQGDDIDGAWSGIRLHRDEQMRLIEHADLSRAAGRRNPTPGEFEHGTAILCADVFLTQHERIDRGRASYVQMVVAEINADRRAGGRDKLLELQTIAITLEDRHGSGAVVHGREQFAFELANAARIAAHAAFALSWQCL